MSLTPHYPIDPNLQINHLFYLLNYNPALGGFEAYLQKYQHIYLIRITKVMVFFFFFFFSFFDKYKGNDVIMPYKSTVL